jgi:hypothetical protein
LRQRISRTKVNAWLEAHPEWHGKPMIYRDGILTLGDPLECECADWGTGDGCKGKVHAYEWYDIFSDDPKGILALCEAHDGYYGNPTEGYFTCDDCGRVFVENYTWELYYTSDEDGMYCLPCAAEHYISEEENWIELTPENIAAVDFKRVRKAKHVIGVEMPVPKSIKFYDNAEFDNMDGHQINGSAIQEVLESARADGYKRALLILDAAYQFAVSIGVYVDSKPSD